MEKDGNTHYWEYRWGDKCYEHLAELYEARRKFRAEFMFDEPDEPKKKEPFTPKEKLEQAEFVECEVVDDTPLGIAFAH